MGACMAIETATAMDNMHPTGMHSCYDLFLQSLTPQIHYWDLYSKFDRDLLSFTTAVPIGVFHKGNEYLSIFH